MRPLAASLLLLTAPAAAVPARAGRAVALARAAEVAPVPFPAHAWSAMQRVELPSPCATPAVTLPDGTVAVGLEAPPAVAFVGRDGQRIALARLERRITQPLAVGRDGRVWVVADRFVFTVAPDGTVRSAAELYGRVEGPATVRADGSAVVVGGSNRASVEYTLLSPEGDPVGVRAPGPVTLSDRAVLADGRIAASDGRALVFLDEHGGLTRAATVPDLRHLAPLGAGLAMAGDRALFLTTPEGSVARRLDLPDAPLWLAPLGPRRVGVALAGTTPQLWIVDAAGDLAARAPLPHGAGAPLVDPAGAALIPARGGDVVCVAPDGAERWRLTVAEALRPPATPLPRGGVAIATEGSGLLLFGDGP